MPKAKKLHNKGKPIALQKNCKIVEDENQANTTESMREFELQLCWCISQLEKTLSEKKGTEKQLQEAWKTVTILKSNNQPLIRKRQLMRTTFGDYRALMAAEENRLVKMASKMKITEGIPKSKATFLRKSTFLTNGDSSFKFNFNVQDLKETEVNLNDNGNTLNRDEDVVNESANSNDVNSSKTIANKINFTSLDSDFKFNFNVDNS